MIDIGTAVRIKKYNIPGKVVSHHGGYNVVQYLTQVFGDPNMTHVNKFGCLDEELEVRSER